MLSRSSVNDQPLEATEPGGLSRRFKKLALYSLCLIGPSLMGCTALNGLSQELSYNDSFSEWVISQRNAAFAAKAWHLRKHHFCNERYLDDFCAGFRAGYMDVAGGGNGCTPAFPPKEYWSWKYQSAEGQARTAAWFAGYPHGARAAEEDGLGNFSQLQMSSSVFNEYHQAGAPGSQAHIYPMPEPQPSYVPASQNMNVPVQGVPVLNQAIPEGGSPIPSAAYPTGADAASGGYPGVIPGTVPSGFGIPTQG